MEPAQQEQDHTQPPVTPPTNPEQAPKPKSPRLSIFKIILIVVGVFILLVILLAVGIYFYLKSQGLTPEKLNPAPLTPKTTIAPRDEKTSTYKNENYNFSMPIEKNMDIKESSYGFGVSSMELRTENTPSELGPDIQMLIFPKAIGAAINQDFDKFYGLADNATEEVKDPSGAAVQFTKVRNRTVSGNRAYEFSSTSMPVDPEVEKEIGVYIEIGGDVLIISTPESNRGKLEQMLVDFKYPQ